MVVACIKTNIQSKIVNVTTMIPCRHVSLRPELIIHNFLSIMTKQIYTCRENIRLKFLIRTNHSGGYWINWCRALPCHCYYPLDIIIITIIIIIIIIIMTIIIIIIIIIIITKFSHSPKFQLLKRSTSLPPFWTILVSLLGRVFATSFRPRDFVQMASDKPFNCQSGLWLLVNHNILRQTCSKFRK